MRTSEIDPTSKDLNVNTTEYASFLGNRYQEFKIIADSGYGFHWFAQCFYRYWQDKREIDNLELWGNMGSHYSSQKISQFSEVMLIQKRPEYKSNIFIVTLIGSEKRVRKELGDLKKYICKSELPLPFKIFLINFRLKESKKDPIAFDSNTLFQGINWVPSFEASIHTRSHMISIGCLNNDLACLPTAEL